MDKNNIIEFNNHEKSEDEKIGVLFENAVTNFSTSMQEHGYTRDEALELIMEFSCICEEVDRYLFENKRTMKVFKN